MLISDLSDKELGRFAHNYRRANKKEGGKFSLAEILLEQHRRKPAVFGVREVAAQILEHAAASGDGLVTYGEIWSAFCPDTPWTGHKSLRTVSNSLARVISYCVRHRLPLLNVLVVRTNNRTLSQRAVQNIYKTAEDLGVAVGLDAKAFVDSQMRQSRAFMIDRLPDDD